MNDAVWLKLAHRLNDVVASPDVDGVIITHGTDTFVASGELGPGKSRVLLQLALTKTRDPTRVQQMSNQY